MLLLSMAPHGCRSLPWWCLGVALFSISCLVANWHYPRTIVILSNYLGIDGGRPKLTEISKQEFVGNATQLEIPPFRPSPIQKLCSQEEIWPKDLVFQCVPADGGLSNLRQQILTCVRWAMEFRGALIVPLVRPRRDTNTTGLIVHEYGDPRGMETIFDRDKFLSRLKASCPQMAVFENSSMIAEPGKIQKVFGEILIRTHSTLEEVRALRSVWESSHKAEDGKIRLATIGRAATEYEICNDDAEFADTFGQLLPLQDDAYKLAATVLYELAKRYSLGFDSLLSFGRQGFLGLHLRTSSDAVKENWMSYEAQSEIYQRFSAVYNLPVIFVASGNESSIQLFREKMFPTPVLSKSDLLSAEELSLLESLSWDQQAQVDYLVLCRASRYMGMYRSNFSWAVAVARRAGAPGGTCARLRRHGLNATEGFALWDEQSVIVGSSSDSPRWGFGTRSWP